MPLDSHGVYRYTEADTAGTASGLLEKGQDALTKANTPVVVDVGGVFTAAAGWTVTGGSMVRMGHHRMLMIEAKRIGAAISVPTTGNIVNAVVGSLTVVSDRPPITAVLSSGLSGRSMSGGIRSTGAVEIGAVGGSVAVATDEQVQLLATWIAAGVVVTP